MVGALLLALVTYLAIAICFGIGQLLWVGLLVYVVAASLHFPDFKNRRSWNRTAIIFFALLLLQLVILGFASAAGTVAPKGVVADFSESTGRLGGQLYGEARLNKLGRYLERRNVTLVRDADARIHVLDRNGAFIANRYIPSELPLRSNATIAKVLHGLSHFRHLKPMHFDAYLRADRLGREQTVYDTIVNNRYWHHMTQDERDIAIDFILRLGGTPLGRRRT